MCHDRHRTAPFTAGDVTPVCPVFAFRTDSVDVGGTRVQRSTMIHDDAVAIVAIRGGEVPGQRLEMLVMRQYRHPVHAELVEIPAGLCDDPAEDPFDAAQRELAEEAGLGARRWNTLVDYYTSPGCSTEALRIYLARDTYPVATDFEREAEEAEIEPQWVPVAKILEGVLTGTLHSPTLVTGVLALIAVMGAHYGVVNSANDACETMRHFEAALDEAVSKGTLRNPRIPWDWRAPGGGMSSL